MPNEGKAGQGSRARIRKGLSEAFDAFTPPRFRSHLPEANSDTIRMSKLFRAGDWRKIAQDVDSLENLFCDDLSLLADECVLHLVPALLSVTLLPLEDERVVNSEYALLDLFDPDGRNPRLHRRIVDAMNESQRRLVDMWFEHQVQNSRSGTKSEVNLTPPREAYEYHAERWTNERRLRIRAKSISDS